MMTPSSYEIATANSRLVNASGETITPSADQVNLEEAAYEAEASEDEKEVEKAVCSLKPNKASTNQKGSTPSGGIASHRATELELNWKEGQIVADATPLTFDFVGERDVESINQRQKPADITAASSENTEASTVSETSETVDDLTKIHGIGPATAEHLQKFGIRSFRSLSETNSDRLQAILRISGSNSKLVESSSSWIQQSRFAMVGDWHGLSKWQASQCVAGGESLQQNDLSDAKESKSQDKTNVATVGSTGTDDLTKIRGLGKASQKVLNNNGIYSFTQVASMTSQQLDMLFADSPKRFQLINTSTWAAQAQQFANAGSSSQKVSSQILEAEILDEIDSIREIAVGAKTSSSTQREKDQTSNRN